MNDYCNKLNLDLCPITPDFDFLSVTKPHSQIDLQYLNPLLRNILYKLNVRVTFIELYYKKVITHQRQLHIDCEYGDYTKINWVTGGPDSTMNWYTVKPGLPIPNRAVPTTGNTICTLVLPDEVDLAHQEYLSGLYLVQVGVPHDVYNPLEDRYCICCTLRYIDTNQRLTMTDAQRILQEYIAQ